MNVAGLMAIFVLMSAAAGSGPSSASYTPIGQIGFTLPSKNSTVTVRATLTLIGNPSYIQDSTGGAAVSGLTGQGLRIGDVLLITGHPEASETGTLLQNSSAELLWHGSPLPPLSVTADEAAQGKFAAQLIEVNGRLLNTSVRNGEVWLWLDSGHQVFLAHFISGRRTSLISRVEIGSVLRLRGVCSLLPRDTRFQGGFAILLRSAEDVSVIAGPPWWNLQHLFELGFLLAALILAGHVTLVQILKARFRSIMAERARMGHELHDTLAQSFAGVSYQIQAARRIVPQSNHLLTRHLDLALEMVRHSHSEAHRSIMMLRPHSLEEGTDLHSAIQAALEQITAGCQLDVRFTSRGPVTRLPLIMTDTLYRVAQEGIANALRHGRPSELEVNLEYTATSACLSVRDNGVGFDPKTSRSQGFGMAGMRERVRAVRGNFSVESAPGSGTCIRAEIHLRRSTAVRLLSAMRQKPQYVWNKLQRIFQQKHPESSW
jgi:signal transduction histidine kinase